MGHVWGLLQLETIDVYRAWHLSGRVVDFVYHAGQKTGLSVDNMAWDLKKRGAAPQSATPKLY
jgi:hypothetical protein